MRTGLYVRTGLINGVMLERLIFYGSSSVQHPYSASQTHLGLKLPIVWSSPKRYLDYIVDVTAAIDSDEKDIVHTGH